MTWETDLYTSKAGLQAVLDWYDNFLPKLSTTLTTPVNTRYLQTRYGRTHIIQSGNPHGQPVLLLHGLNNNATIWEPQLDALSDFCVYAVDIIGQPGRSAAYRPSLAGDDYSCWLLDVLDALNIERVMLMGLSMGGYLTMKFGAYAPERLERAVLLAPAGLVLIKAGLTLQIAASNLPFRDPVESKRALLETVFTEPRHVPMQADPTAQQELIEIVHMHQRPLSGLRDAFESMLPGIPLWASEIKRFTAPTLVMVGDQDALFDADSTVKRAENVLPELISAEVMPESGHAMTYQHPYEVNARLVEFLHTGR